MDIPLDVKVFCTDGEAGRSTAIVMNPVTNEVTHVVVDGKGALLGEYLVPLDAVEKSSPHQLDLRWALADLAKADRFDKAIFLGDESGAAMLWPYGVADEAYFGAGALPAYMEVEQVPHAELAVHRGAHVHATNGGVGQVDEFVVDSKTSHITHLVLRKGHLWGKRDITVPISAIDHVADDVVYLKLDKEAIEQLPVVPVRR